MPRLWTLPTWPFHVTSPFRGIHGAPQRPSCRWPRVYQHVRAMWGGQPVFAALSCVDPSTHERASSPGARTGGAAGSDSYLPGRTRRLRFVKSSLPDGLSLQIAEPQSPPFVCEPAGLAHEPLTSCRVPGKRGGRITVKLCTCSIEQVKDAFSAWSEVELEQAINTL